MSCHCPQGSWDLTVEAICPQAARPTRPTHFSGRRHSNGTSSVAPSLNFLGHPHFLSPVTNKPPIPVSIFSHQPVRAAGVAECHWTVPFDASTHILGHLDEGEGVLRGLRWQHASAEGRWQDTQAGGRQDLSLQRTQQANSITYSMCPRLHRRTPGARSVNANSGTPRCP